MCMYGWVPSLSTWNYHSIVNWLYPRTNLKVQKKKIHHLDGSAKTYGWQAQAHEKMPHTTCHQRNANRNFIRHNHTPIRMAKIQGPHQMLVRICKNRVTDTWLWGQFQAEHVSGFRRDRKLYFSGFGLRKICVWYSKSVAVGPHDTVSSECLPL